MWIVSFAYFKLEKLADYSPWYSKYYEFDLEDNGYFYSSPSNGGVGKDMGSFTFGTAGDMVYHRGYYGDTGGTAYLVGLFDLPYYIGARNCPQIVPISNDEMLFVVAYIEVHRTWDSRDKQEPSAADYAALWQLHADAQMQAKWDDWLEDGRHWILSAYRTTNNEDPAHGHCGTQCR